MKIRKFSKFKIYPSFILLVAICVVFRRVGLLVNYLLALSLHELSHMLVASIKGYSLKEFRLDMFGASIELENYIDDKDSFLINIAGPIGNIVLCIMCLAAYYLFPNSYIILNEFCMANLVLAVFNLLPIYPLDGGKILNSFFKTDKSKKVFNIIAKTIILIISVIAFVFGVVNHRLSIVPILIIIFVLTTKSETKLELALFKNKDFSKIQSVNILRVNEDDSLISVLKKVKKNRYTIFYCTRSKKFLDEDCLVDLALKYQPTTKIKDIV